MPLFKAKFRKGLKVDAPITLALGVSMDCVQQSGEQLAAFLGLVVEHKSMITNLQIVCSDDLYRFYHGWTESTPESERTAIVDKLYNDWLQENWKYLSFFKDLKNVLCREKNSTVFSDAEIQEIAALFFGVSNEEGMARTVEKLRTASTINLEIIRWRTLLNTPEYSAAKQQVDAAYRDNPEFKNIITSVAAQHSKEKALDTVIAFLLEETAVFIGPLKSCQLAYSSPNFNQAILWAMVNIAHQPLIYHGYSLTPRKPIPADSMVAASSSAPTGETRKTPKEDAIEFARLMLQSVLDSRRGGRGNIQFGAVHFQFEIDPTTTPTYPPRLLGGVSSFFGQPSDNANKATQNPEPKMDFAPQ